MMPSQCTDLPKVQPLIQPKAIDPQDAKIGPYPFISAFSKFALIFKICVIIHCLSGNVRNTFKELFSYITDHILIHFHFPLSINGLMGRDDQSTPLNPGIPDQLPRPLLYLLFIHAVSHHSIPRNCSQVWLTAILNLKSIDATPMPQVTLKNYMDGTQKAYELGWEKISHLYFY